MNILEITIQYRRGDTWPVVAEHRQPGELPGRSEGPLLLGAEPQQQLTPFSQDGRGYGAVLGEALFQGPIRDRFMAARAAGGESGLHVLLVVEDPQLKPLHWENLCAPDGRGGWDYLALDRRTPFSRYLPSLTDLRFPAIGSRDLRALVVLADPPADNPYGLAHFDAAAGAAAVAASLGEIPHELLAPLPQAGGPASLDALAERISAGSAAGPYTLLHLAAHGRLLDGETILYLLDADARVKPVKASDLIERLRRLGGERGLPHLVLLAACEGAKPEAEAQSARGGLAQRLVRELGIPAVVAMTDRVSIITATELTRAFYARLRADGAPDLALVEAGAGLQGRPDALVPALFSRLGDRPLFGDRLDGDRPLTGAEIDFGVARLTALLPERAPILLDAAKAQAATPGLAGDPQALSPAARQERTAALDALDALSQEVLDLSFPALALDRPVPAWDGRCPFPGLAAFQCDEQSFFFGREAEVQRLTGRLRAERLLAVLGASGSGKSSLVLAGLVPDFLAAGPHDPGRLRRLTPGADPDAALARQLDEPPAADRDTLLVIDQFEEVFTLCTDAERRRSFVARLIGAWQAHPRLFVVATLRADFWGDCAPYPALKDALQAHQELIAPMDTAQLRSAMEQQAAAVGLRFEGDLSHGILAEVEGEPGAMPLLQHLLLELWRRRHGRWLRTSEYRALGGIRQAIAHTADGIYAELNADPGGQGLLRSIFVRLTRLDAGGAEAQDHRDTRQRVAFADLVPAGSDPERVRDLIRRLADRRLVVSDSEAQTGETQVEVAHEALIRYWPRLRNWLDEDRASWILLANLRQDARDWQAAGERETDLPRWGGRLQQAETLYAQERFAPTELERRFVAAAKALHERECAEREQEQRARLAALEAAAQAAQERAAAQAQAAAQARGKTRVALAGFVVALVLMLAAGWQWHNAVEQEREARSQTARVYWNSAVAERERDPLKSAHSFAAAATRLAALGRPAESANALLALKFIVGRPLLQAEMAHETGNGSSPIFSADGTRALTWTDDGTVRLWDGISGAALAPAFKHAGAGRRDAAFSKDGARILTWSDDGTARLWASATGTALIPPLKHGGPVAGAAFSPDESRILTWSEDGTARLWASATGAALAAPLKHEGPISDARFSRDGSRILTRSEVTLGEKTARLWDSASGAEIPLLKQHEAVEGAQFSNNGARVLTWNEGTARLWDSKTGKLAAAPLKHGGKIRDAQLSKDDSRILTLSEDPGTAKLWDGASGAALPPLKHDGQVQGAQFSKDGTRLLTWSDDGTAQLWNSATGKAFAPPFKNAGQIVQVEFSADDSRILTWGMGDPAQLWESATGKEIISPLVHEGRVIDALFSADGSRILTSHDGTVRLWDSSNGTALGAPLSIGMEATAHVQFTADQSQIVVWTLVGTSRLWDGAGAVARGPSFKHDGRVNGARFSKDSTRILSWSEDGTAGIWDSTSGAALSPPLKHDGSVSGARFSADESRILTWSADGTARVWSSSDGAALTPPLKHGGQVRGARFSADESRILTWGGDRARLWESSSGAPLDQPLKQNDSESGPQLSADGSRILTWSDDTARVWDSVSGEPLAAPLKHDEAVEGARFSANESRILTWGKDGARLWDSRSAAPLTPPFDTDSWVLGARFSSDESRILTWSKGGSARVWDSAGGAPLSPPLEHGMGINTAAITDAHFSPDGLRILTAGYDRTARVWNSTTGAPLFPPLKHDDVVWGARFSADASRILTWSADGTARIWDSASGAPLSPPLRHNGDDGPDLDRDGSRLLTWSDDGTLRVQDLSLDKDWPINEVTLRVAAETGTKLEPSGEVTVLSPADWQRKRFCEYDAIRHDLKRLTDAEWAQSQLRCGEAR